MMKSPLLSRILPGRMGTPKPVVAVLSLSGVIGQIGPMRRGLSLSGLADPIERAFKPRHLSAVALAINSPGGSAAQSALIHKRIRAHAAEKGVPVFAFVEDVAASGGYMLACAGDEIFADESSLIGSIGVVSSGFGFTGLIERLGVERRVHATDPRKTRLDPFLDERPEDVEFLRGIQEEAHKAFRDLVAARRGTRLDAPEDELYSGDVWIGTRALAMGLIDGIGDLRSVMRARFGDQVRFQKVEGERGWLRRRLGIGASGGLAGGSLGALGQDWAGTLIAAAEERLYWSRFGL
ncbi:MAG: S49 family peptidase [Rhodospirillaceae bacterium]|nr:S49 family peptidase [Rhodospirillaceae bacterium]